MNRNAAFVLGLAASGAVAYGVWRSLTGMAIRAMEAQNDRLVTQESEDSFPASDAPSHTPLTGSLVGSRY